MNKWLKRIRAHQGIKKGTLVCFPHGGAGSTFINPILHQIEPGQEVLCLVLPGKLERLREPGLSDWGELMEAIQGPVIDCLDFPTVFYGHSMGTLLAYEVARALWEKGASQLPRALILSGRRAPHTEVGLHAYPLDNDQAFLDKLKLMKGIPQQILEDERLLQLFLPILKRDFQLIASYPLPSEQHLPALPIPFHVFSGAEDTISTPSLQAWSELTSKEMVLEILNGDHFFPFKAKSGFIEKLNLLLKALA
jgi:surfactin synthase thioesterase subunit